MFNKKSRQIIQNIYDESRNNPIHEGFFVFAEEIRLNNIFNTYVTLQLCPYQGAPWLERYDFYSDAEYSLNPTGRIGSIAIYYALEMMLDMQLGKILHSGKCLGLPIKEASIDRGGNLPFIDVYLDAYDENSKGYPFEKY